jgi:hypothetical protein
MEHPFIHDLEDLTLEQLGSKISELHKKLNIAHRMGNGYLCDQIRMAIESYNGKYQQKMRALSAPKAGETDLFNDKIDIS